MKDGYKKNEAEAHAPQENQIINDFENIENKIPIENRDIIDPNFKMEPYRHVVLILYVMYLFYTTIAQMYIQPVSKSIMKGYGTDAETINLGFT